MSLQDTWIKVPKSLVKLKNEIWWLPKNQHGFRGSKVNKENKISLVGEKLKEYELEKRRSSLVGGKHKEYELYRTCVMIIEQFNRRKQLLKYVELKYNGYKSRPIKLVFFVFRSIFLIFYSIFLFIIILILRVCNYVVCNYSNNFKSNDLLK